MIEAVVIEDSISSKGKRIVTLKLTYPRIVHAELLTHRVFSRNSSSSRAIPVIKMIRDVWDNPAKPVRWGRNEPGMQAHTDLAGWRELAVSGLWWLSSRISCGVAWAMSKCGAHKQIANRILEPFQHIRVVVTSTEWENFFDLRYHEDADPTILALAREMHRAIAQSKPEMRFAHLPFVTQEERGILSLEVALKVSTARCARVSYLTHDGKEPNLDADLKLYERLVGSRPLHASPAEHQAWESIDGELRSGNFVGWIQHRKILEESV